MWALALAAVVALPADTVSVRPGDVLVIERLSGELVIEGGGDDAISVLLDETGGFRFDRRDNEVVLRASRGRMLDGRVVLQVPTEVEVRVSGGELDVEIADMHGGVSVRTLDGNVHLSRTTGELGIFTLDGDLTLRDGEGSAVLSTLDGLIEVEGFTGNIQAETTDGDVILRRLDSPRVQASTLDGDMHFQGTIGASTDLNLGTHSGDVTLDLPEGVSAAFEVSTYDGNFESDFPVRVSGLEARQALRFTLGAGQARIRIQNFDGDIRLRRR